MAGHKMRGTGLVIMLLLAGCVGKGEVIPVPLQVVQSGAEQPTKPSQTLRIAVTAFEDARTEKSWLGRRTHLWGGETYFEVPSGKPGEAAALAIVEYLRSKGWRADFVKSGGAAEGHGATVTLTGQLLDLSVDAKSRVGSTAIAARTQMAIQALNRADGSTVRMTLNGTGSQSVFWFEPEDVQALLDDVLSESLDRLLQSTKVDNGLLRLK